MHLLCIFAVLLCVFTIFCIDRDLYKNSDALYLYLSKWKIKYWNPEAGGDLQSRRERGLAPWDPHTLVAPSGLCWIPPRGAPALHEGTPRYGGHVRGMRMKRTTRTESAHVFSCFSFKRKTRKQNTTRSDDAPRRSPTNSILQDNEIRLMYWAV